VGFDDDGCPFLVIDWKSDVDQDESTLSHYQDQVARYLASCDIREGMRSGGAAHVRNSVA
jgi:hypothetical protein